MIGNAVLVAAAVAAGACMTGKALQEPAFDFRFAVPHYTMSPQDHEPVTTEWGAVSQGKGEGTDSSPFWTSPAKNRTGMLYLSRSDPLDAKLVSTNFHATKASDVLTWLERKGLSFIIADDSLKAKTITMSIVNQPLGETADGLAAALGGHWVRKGKIRVFRQGTEAFSVFSGGGAGFSTFPALNGSDWKFPSGTGVRNLANPRGLTYWAPGKGMVQLNNKLISPTKFLDSLTAAQKATMKKKGYLKPADLTPEQIKMLGIDKKSQGSVSFSVDGKSATIKFP